jgi:flagellar motility protein MotE (MotC chaperone)
MKVALIITFLVATAASAIAEEKPHAPAADAAMPEAVVTAAEPQEDYCANIADKARDARYVLQNQAIADASATLAAEKQAFTAERAAFEAEQKKRNAELVVAQKGVVDIYAKMKPDVAAAQLEFIGIETASAILRELNVRSASTILNEMNAETAAKISKRLASAAGLPMKAKTP